MPRYRCFLVKPVHHFSSRLVRLSWRTLAASGGEQSTYKHLYLIAPGIELGTPFFWHVIEGVAQTFMVFGHRGQASVSWTGEPQRLSPRSLLALSHPFSSTPGQASAMRPAERSTRESKVGYLSAVLDGAKKVVFRVSAEAPSRPR